MSAPRPRRRTGPTTSRHSSRRARPLAPPNPTNQSPTRAISLLSNAPPLALVGYHGDVFAGICFHAQAAQYYARHVRLVAAQRTVRPHASSKRFVSATTQSNLKLFSTHYNCIFASCTESMTNTIAVELIK